MSLNGGPLGPSLVRAAAGAVLALSAIAAAAQPTMVRITDPISPQRVVRTVAGDCGANRFQIVIGPGVGARERAVEVQVNGDTIAAGEREKFVSRLLDGSVVMDASIAECADHQRTARARVQLLVQQPARGPRARFLEFWVSPSGEVSGVRFN